MNLNMRSLILGAEQAAIEHLDNCGYSPELDISISGDSVVITLSDSNGEQVENDTMKHWLDVVLTHLHGYISDSQLESVWNGGTVEDDYAKFRVAICDVEKVAATQNNNGKKIVYMLGYRGIDCLGKECRETKLYHSKEAAMDELRRMCEGKEEWSAMGSERYIWHDNFTQRWIEPLEFVD